MFKDLEFISLYVVDGDNAKVPDRAREMKLGYFAPNFDPKQWDRSFYLQAGIDPEKRYSSFHVSVNENFESSKPDGEYAFVESLFYKGLKMVLRTKLPVIHNAPVLENLWSWRPYIENATEIECSDCGMMNMIESCNLKAKKLWFHDNRESVRPSMLRYNWETVPYVVKKSI